MALMAEWGYLLQPHTSAGRIPSDRGYRYYVDSLMSRGDALQTTESADLTAVEPGAVEIEEIIQRTCRLLADMTLYPAIASLPLANVARLHRCYLTGASPRHLLVVMLLSTGHVEHRLLDVDHLPSESSLQKVTNYLNTLLAGSDLKDLTTGCCAEVPAELYNEQGIITRVHACMVQVAESLLDSRLLMEGTSHILRQNEFRDVLLLERLMAVLEEKSVLNRVFSQAIHAQDILVIIGSESQYEAMQRCSIVVSSYSVGDHTSGFIGLFGPTRMNYDRTCAAVSMMARSLSALLSRASLG
jgi:heat-inducible transcriptional repressor